MFVPNPKAVQETCETMLAIRRGGYRDSYDDALWFAWDNAFSVDHENGRLYWLAVHARLTEMRKESSI